MAARFTAILLRPLYWAIWSDSQRRARKLLQFAEVEAEGGRDLVRAAELTNDPHLRRLFLAHARDEQRHARLFRNRGLELHAEYQRPVTVASAGLVAGGERGLDDLNVEDEDDRSLLAFIHLSESAAARDFASYRSVLGHDPRTRAVFETILREEEFHMRYSRVELERVSGGNERADLWKARLRRVWKAYLRLAMGLANIISTVLLTLQYFILLPPFALFAKFAAVRDQPGWVQVEPMSDGAASPSNRGT
jgi:rubrerythrin